MKCRFCGAKIGILERWRFGDFCSKEHKDEFAVDLVKLNEQIVQDLRKIPSRYKLGNKEETRSAEAPPEQPAQQPDPPEAIFLLEADPDPLVEVPAARAAEEPQPQRSKSEQWRLFSKMADWEGLPPTAAAASKEKEKKDAFLWVQMDQPSDAGPTGLLLAGAFPAILPRRMLRRTQGHMPMSPVWVPPDPRQTAADDARRYAVGGSIQQFVQDHAWGWMAEAIAGTMPGLAPVLAAYPLTAPWTNWTIVAPSQPMLPPRPQQAMPMGGAPGMPPQAMGPAAAGNMFNPAGPPAGTAAPPPGGLAMPPSAMAGGMMSQAPSMASMPGLAAAPGGLVVPPPPMIANPAGSPALYQAPPAGASPAAAPGYGAMPTGAMPVWPSAGPMAAAGAMVPPGSVVSPQGIAYPTQRLVSPGLTWRELPPPLFSALVDLGGLLTPASLPFVQRTPAVTSIRPELVIAGQLPNFAATLEYGMPFVDCQGDPSEDLLPFAPRPHRPRSHARTLWRRHLVLPKAYGGVGQTRVPVKSGPAFIFSLRQSLPAPEGKPQLQIGRWRT